MSMPRRAGAELGVDQFFDHLINSFNGAAPARARNSRWLTHKLRREAVRAFELQLGAGDQFQIEISNASNRFIHLFPGHAGRGFSGHIPAEIFCCQLSPQVPSR